MKAWKAESAAGDWRASIDAPGHSDNCFNQWRELAQLALLGVGSAQRELWWCFMGQATHQSDNRGSKAVAVPSPHKWLRGAPPWLVSCIVHAAVIIALALLSLPELRQQLDFALDATESERADDLEDLPNLQLTEALQVEAVTPLSELAPNEMALSDLASLELSSVGTTALPAELATLIGGSLSDGGAALAPLSAGMGETTTFFGQKAAANRIVFMVDNSNSMTSGKLETALVELAKAIDTLKPTQSFYVVFYSDTAYPLFHPESTATMVKATESNKVKATYWLNTIEMCLRTDGRDALAIVRELRPNLVYILGDGAFTDNTAKDLVNNRMIGVTIHTLGMQVQQKDQADFRAIAEKHKGTYRDVGVTDEGKALLKQMGPRPRHRTHDNYWGLKLPEK